MLSRVTASSSNTMLVGLRTVLQELAGETGIGSESQILFAFDDAGVEAARVRTKRGPLPFLLV